jgi:hypothetical protein
MSEVKFAADNAKAVISEVRKDSSATNWVVCGYDSSNQIVLQAQGTDGAAGLQAAFDAKQIQYGYLRTNDVVDGHATTKFVFVVWLGSQVKTVAKARVTTHRGAVKDFFGQAHVTIDASTEEEASEAAIMEKVTDASGTSVRVLKDETAGNREAGDRKVVGLGKKTAGNLEIRDRAGIAAALGAVRSGAQGQDWALVLYDSADSNNVALAGTGTGGADEIATHLTHENIGYGLIRVPIQVDGNDVTRFVLISHVGSNVSGVHKAQKVTHKGQLLDVVGQFHTDVASENSGEVSAAIVAEAVARAAGTRDNQTSAAPSQNKRVEVSPRVAAPAPVAHAAAPAPAKKYSSPGASLVSQPKKGNAVNTSSVALNFEDREGIQSALQAVRADNNPSDWALIGYAADTTLKLVGGGAGGADELAKHIDDAQTGAYYGLVRVNTVVDGQSLVRFVFIFYLGDQIKVVRKAKITTHRGAIQEIIGQFHLDITAASAADISSEAVAKRVSINTFESTKQ